MFRAGLYGLRQSLAPARVGLLKSATGPQLRTVSKFAMPMRRFATQVGKPPLKRLTMKELVKEYGWMATGVYAGLCLIDLPLFYLLVHEVGKEKFLEAEIYVRVWLGASTEKEDTYLASMMESKNGQFFAEFGVAYVLHKLFIVVRVPLTVAFTPAITARLQSWGFKVGPKLSAAATAEAAKNSAVSGAGAGAAAAVKEGAKDFGKPPTKGNKWFSWFM